MKVTYESNQSENVQTEKGAKLSIFYVDTDKLYVNNGISKLWII